MFDDYNHGSDMKKNGTGGYPILTGDSNGNFKDFKSNIIQNITIYHVLWGVLFTLTVKMWQVGNVIL